MKTKKVLALVVLAAFLISIVPFAAFGLDVYNSSVEVTEDRASAAAAPVKNTDDGAEFEVALVDTSSGDKVYVAASRPTATTFFYDDGDKWVKIGVGSVVIDVDTMTTRVASGSTTRVLTLKAVSTAASTTQIVFASENCAEEYALGQDWPTITDVLGNNRKANLGDIIGGQKFPVEFTAPKAGEVSLSIKDFSTANMLDEKLQKPANNVDAYTVVAFVTTGSGVPVSATDVTFSITSGTGASLSATKATTSAAGKAEVKIYSSKAGSIEILGRVSGLAEQTGSSRTDKTTVIFKSTGIVSIKAESDNNQKVARESSGEKAFRFSAYDASGARLDFIKLLSVNTSATGFKWSDTDADAKAYMKDIMKASIVSKPSGASLKDSDIGYRVHSSGNMNFLVPHDKLNKDGDYEVKIYLVNGVSVSYKFSVKDQGDVTKMLLSYGSSSYSAGTVVPQPDVKYQDAEGYEISKALDMSTNSQLKLSISDASFMDGQMATTGQFKLKDDKSGVIKMTLVDTEKNLVATQDLSIEKAASYLKLTPQSVGAIGSEVNVNIELVDVDGKLAASGLGSVSASAAIIAKPEGAIATASSVDVADFSKGKASVKVSSNVEGDVTLQVIITEQELPIPNSTPAANYGGRTYTGAATVSFGRASTGSGQVIFIVGAPSYVSGNQVFAAESPSFIENGRTFLGVRDMGTSIGATIEWDQASQTATLSKDGIIIKVTVGANKIAVTKNGVTSEIEIDAPAQNKNGRVYLPFRAVMEAFNYTVTFDQATNSIVCTL